MDVGRQLPIANDASTFDVRYPANRTAPVVFASPHSGNRYSSSFMATSRLGARAIRRSEDAFVDEIFAAAADYGAPLIRAHFPRAYVDANREPYELDPEMFAEPLPKWVNTSSPRVAAGLGTIAKIVAGGAEIYRSRLSFSEVRQRIEACHIPYHRSLQNLIDDSLAQYGACLLVDCHSMPSIAVPGNSSQVHADIVLGDCHGSSCGSGITQLAEDTLRGLGLRVARNKPYAGGYTTRHYARPHAGIHTLQIEINRSLYMNEQTLTKNAGFDRLADQMRHLTGKLASISPDMLAPPLAAE